MIIPVILAGGSGTRLWPMSRKNFPKQLLSMHEDRTMLQATITRIGGLDTAPPIVVCNEAYRFTVAEQIRELGLSAASIILEPFGRNTAPAIAIAALRALEIGEDPILLVLPADHVILDEEAFSRSVDKGRELAERGRLVTFGVAPSHPETGYGYLEATKKGEVCKVTAFVEKPTLEVAAGYVRSGCHYWNSGIFMFSVSTLLGELRSHSGEIAEASEIAFSSLVEDLDFLRLDPNKFANCPNESIDYAVMEKSKKVWVVPLNAGWSDVGGWASLHEVSTLDENQNACFGDVISVDTKNSYLRSESKLLVTIGVSNVVVVDTPDALLVASSDRVQEVKGIVDLLKQAGRPEWEIHREVFRPWGKYDSVDSGDRYQVKRITVNPGQRLSVQMHHHRAEHWVVVTGTAKVGKDNTELLVTENESVYIPVGCVHWLENPGKIPLELIEIQSGPYLGEDDITRFEDRYGR